MNIINYSKEKRRTDLGFSVENPPIANINGTIEFNELKCYYPSDTNKKNVLFQSGKILALVNNINNIVNNK